MRTLRIAAMVAVSALVSAGASSAEEYPARTVRWLVPSAAGGAFDIMTRGLAPAMSEQTGQTFYVDNIGGASGLLGMETGARADPDGYTILTAGTSQLVMNPFFISKLPYDPAKDFAGVALLGTLPIALWETQKVPARSFEELVRYTRAHPKKLNYGSAGVGHIFHLGMELLSERTGLQAVHIPYKGVGPAIQDFLAGRIDLMFSVAQRPVMAQYRAGKIRPLAAAATHRLKLLPDVPTFDELGVKDMAIPNWVGLVVPAGTPREIIARLNREVIKATQSEQAQKTYEGMAMDAEASTPEGFEELVRDDARKWGPFVKKLGIKPQ
jgi:tripartite-type tricarboxylate transporter receptor subunit TctC